ncbi:hypothetical protein [Flavobacterium psychrotrophum]|uniref:hypothetical protein n=1 Tax=Flavobacterium psychrotrophum TaxID=2294119 RepID=UPI0013C4E3B4|nr:hypothetical protein [Flavobacterium psychrotrophum]
MKKQLLILFTAIIAIVAVISCNNDDNSAGANPIIGTWKLVEQYTNSNPVSLNSCEMEETYIFGPEQFTHELYENGGKPGRADISALRGDDDDDDDHSSSDDDDDEHSSDDDESDDNGTTPTDDNSDDDSDDDSGNGNGGSGNCVNSDRNIGYWTARNNVYTFTVGATNDVKTITFTDANNRFYIETTTTVGTTTVTRRYVYQKQ